MVGVEFECGHCHARLLYKLPDEPVRIAFQCPNCNERFYDADRQGDVEELFRLMVGLPRLAKDAKAAIRIQISPQNPIVLEGERSH